MQSKTCVLKSAVFHCYLALSKSTKLKELLRVMVCKVLCKS